MKTYKFLSLNNLKGGSLECKLKNMCRIVQKIMMIKPIDRNFFNTYLQKMCNILIETILSMLNDTRYIDLLTNICISSNDGDGDGNNILSIYSLNITLFGKNILSETPTLIFNGDYTYPKSDATDELKIFEFTPCVVENPSVLPPSKTYILNTAYTPKKIDEIKKIFEQYCKLPKNISLNAQSKNQYNLNLNLFYVIYKLINILKEKYLHDIYTIPVDIHISLTPNTPTMNFLHITNIVNNLIDKIKAISRTTIKQSSETSMPIDIVYFSILYNIFTMIQITHIKKKNNVFILNESIYFLYIKNCILLQIGDVIFKITPSDNSSTTHLYFIYTIIYKNKYAITFTRQTSIKVNITFNEPTSTISNYIILNEKSNDNIAQINKHVVVIDYTIGDIDIQQIMGIDRCIYKMIHIINQYYYNGKKDIIPENDITTIFKSINTDIQAPYLKFYGTENSIKYDGDDKIKYKKTK